MTEREVSKTPRTDALRKSLAGQPARAPWVQLAETLEGELVEVRIERDELLTLLREFNELLGANGWFDGRNHADLKIRSDDILSWAELNAPQEEQ